jgi:hypothetical protein
VNKPNEVGYSSQVMIEIDSKTEEMVRSLCRHLMLPPTISITEVLKIPRDDLRDLAMKMQDVYVRLDRIWRGLKPE